MPAKFWQPIPKAETSSEPSMRRSALDGRDLAEDPVAPLCAARAGRGSKDAAANPRPPASNLRRSGIAGPPISVPLCVERSMLLHLR
jgi:hypothetical protein